MYKIFKFPKRALNTIVDKKGLSPSAFHNIPSLSFPNTILDERVIELEREGQKKSSYAGGSHRRLTQPMQMVLYGRMEEDE